MAQGQRHSGEAAVTTGEGGGSGGSVTGAAGDLGNAGAAPMSPRLRVSTQRSSADTAVSLALGIGRGATSGSNSPLGTRGSRAASIRSPRRGSAAAVMAQGSGAGAAGPGQLGGGGSDALDVHLNVLETMSAQGTAHSSSGRGGRHPHWHSSSSLGREAGQSAGAERQAGMAQAGTGQSDEEGVLGRMKAPHRFSSNTLQVGGRGHTG